MLGRFVGNGLDRSVQPSRKYDISGNSAPFDAILCAARSQRCGWVKTHPYITARKKGFLTNLPSLLAGDDFFTPFWVDFLQICINYNRFVIFDGQPAQRTDNLIGQCVCVVGFFPFLSVKFHLVFYPPPVYYNNCQRGRTSTRAPQKNHCKKKEKQL